MKLRRKSRSIFARAAALLICTCAAFCYTASAARASTANWEKSDLDVHFYFNSGSPGTRALGSSFLNALTVDGQQFEPHPYNDPARLGSTLFAFDTASKNIDVGLATYRYKLNSVKFTATLTYDSGPPTLKYTENIISHTDIFAEYETGPITSQRPMELYGVGFRGEYTGFEFVDNLNETVDGPPLLDEIRHPATGDGGSYIAYALVRNEVTPGVFADVDVMNSITGGYSETDTTHLTDPFTPIPMSIGKGFQRPVNAEDPPIELVEEEAIPESSFFEFSLDLEQPGVRSYLQESLGKGELGFFLSSAHSTAQFGSGGGFPRWYLKDAAGFPYFALEDFLPKLVIDYEILPPLEGDYNGNGIVDLADYVLWRNGGPLLNQVHDPSQITSEDYTEWRARFGNVFSGGALGNSQSLSIPEPTGAILILLAVLGLVDKWHRRTR
ncbi:MAG: hypothetical protein WD468_08985 [Pirellulales bacterium]